MNIIVCKDSEEMSQRAADMIADRIQAKPDLVLGLATGSTPIRTYEKLVEMYEAGDLDFSQVTTFNLDEYEGLTPDNIQSYHYFMNHHLFSKVNLPAENTHFPKGDPSYDEEIRQAGGIDLQILGLGVNGHIAFMEPKDALNDFTGRVSLTPQTIQVNSRFFEEGEEVPSRAYSMGMGSIMRTKEIILMANGEKKADAIGKMVNNPTISTWLPVSFIRLHPHASLILDEAAASKIEEIPGPDQEV